MSETMALWFRRKYSLPPTDPRYLAMTPEGIAAEFWANHYADRFYAGRPEEVEDEDEDFDLDEILRQNEADDEDDEEGEERVTPDADLPNDFEEVR